MTAQRFLNTVEFEPDCSNSASVHESSDQEFELWEIKRRNAL